MALMRNHTPLQPYDAASAQGDGGANAGYPDAVPEAAAAMVTTPSRDFPSAALFLIGGGTAIAAMGNLAPPSGGRKRKRYDKRHPHKSGADGNLSVRSAFMWIVLFLKLICV